MRCVLHLLLLVSSLSFRPAVTRPEGARNPLHGSSEAVHRQALQSAKQAVNSAVFNSQQAETAATTSQLSHSEQSREHWRQRWGESTGKGAASPPQLEIVISRQREALDWIGGIPDIWHVTILNRGGMRLPKLPAGRRWAVSSPRGASSDSEAFALYLVNRYDSLADYTIFCPAQPLHINGWFLNLLEHPAKLGAVQALSGVMSKNGTWTMTERISTRTLNSVLVHNSRTVEIAKWFSKDYNLTWGTNLLRKYFEMIGLPDWMDERQEVGSYAPGPMLGFERSRATRHPKSVYAALLGSSAAFGCNHRVIERMWIMLFAGTDFRDSPVRLG